jgi:hypothetical protein
MGSAGRPAAQLSEINVLTSCGYVVEMYPLQNCRGGVSLPAQPLVQGGAVW